MKINILFVCLGNICRSPAAEAVFLNLINEKGVAEYFQVDSAGTGSWHVGQKADNRMRKAASSRGIYIKSLARQINVQDFKKFDLILTMDGENFSSVQNLRKEINDKCKADIRPLLSYSKQTNGLDVPDPYYGGDNGFEIVLDLLEDACKALLNDLIKKD